MVVEGRFKVQLVDGTNNKIPFKEHTDKKGKTYVEAEPDMDYFVQVQILKQQVEDDAKVFVEVVVDGKDLGYSATLGAGEEPEDFGIFIAQGNQNTDKALTFKCPVSGESATSTTTSSTLNSSSNNNKKMVMGRVDVHFALAVWTGKRRRTDFCSEQISPSEVAPTITGGKSLKDLRTGEGSHFETETIISGLEDVYQRGKGLGKITIHYCTALGLVRAGVLNKASYEQSRKIASSRAPNGRSSLVDLSHLEDDVGNVPGKPIDLVSTGSDDDSDDEEEEQMHLGGGNNEDDDSDKSEGESDEEWEAGSANDEDDDLELDDSEDD